MNTSQKKLLLRSILAGGAAAFGSWLILDRVIDKNIGRSADALIDAVAPRMRSELQAQLDREVPPRIRQTLDEVLTEYGITQQTTSNIARILNALPGGR
ncbi:MAG: hypothetical protein IPK85_01530 [Gemmatimonadetes bacterium]|nr:hypothetical protein [Gemmatimonadota bacterium]